MQLLQRQLTAAAAVQVTHFYSDGTTALHAAALKNHLEMAKLLLQHGADVNAKIDLKTNTKYGLVLSALVHAAW